MVHFFGIFSPGALARSVADEAPAKASFFGGRSRDERDMTSMTQVEPDASLTIRPQNGAQALPENSLPSSLAALS
ncbi:hypothetical protein VW35_07960 [Devosia soli]|uniref:Uncharacterized protein n=1 Tax=Devosia soli TaxID=361041 RepID=A0A0F5LD80_9HYPH|nr:hypothetical protein [Devosia soli]KKB80323.1 hypothetical protein VW35_07960 [Devosia soli]